MKYENIKKYFDRGIEGIEEFLQVQEIKDVIISIEGYQSDFKGNIITEGTELKETISRLTGIHGEVLVIAKIAESYTSTNEAREFLEAKKELIDDGKGGQKIPTDDTAKAKSKVNNLVCVRTANLFEAYYKSCGQMIMSAQSLMNYLTGKHPAGQSEN